MPFDPERYSLASSKASVTYSDFTTDMDISPSTGDLILLTDAASIKASVVNISLTDKYERPFNQLIGGSAKKSLFENDTPSAISALRDRVIGNIQTFEPRAKVENVTFTKSSAGQVALTTTFVPITTTQPTTAVAVLGRVR